MEMCSPTPPGEFIVEFYLRPNNVSAGKFAEQRLSVPIVGEFVPIIGMKRTKKTAQA